MVMIMASYVRRGNNADGRKDNQAIQYETSPRGRGLLCRDLPFRGDGIRAGQFVQAVVPAGIWQGAYLLEGGQFALMGATVAPGFDFSDGELGTRKELLERYPQHNDIITSLTED